MAENLPAAYIDLIKLPDVRVPGADAPVAKLNHAELQTLGQRLTSVFTQYKSDRVIQEERWLRNLRQYLGFYDPEIERQLDANRSRAYPKITRVKCISLKARIMDLMFPSDDRNWTLKARPSPDMKITDVQKAIQDAQTRDAAAAGGQPPPVDLDYIMSAVQDLASKRAKGLSVEILDQLQELGGDQGYDYVALNSEVVASGILYGVGLLQGPFARPITTATWKLGPDGKTPVAETITTQMPKYEFCSVWDYYPDLSAKKLSSGDGYFTRTVMSKQQVRKLADRKDFFGDIIKDYLARYNTGNYKPQTFETQLRAMGTKVNVNEQKAESTKYEVITWHGPIDGVYLRAAGVQVEDSKLADQIDAEIWMIENTIIKASMNPWAALGKVEMKRMHAFIFDEDDTSPIGFGLPNVVRDTQMSISSSTRMMLDNASVVCGPILEINSQLMRADQDLTALTAYKIFYRDDDGATAQWPAVRGVTIESHIAELQTLIDFFMKIADMETFVGPMTGGDMSKMPSEPMRNAAGASMLLGNAALPFKEIIRNFDRFTQSVIQSLVHFNMVLNPLRAEVSEYDVIARGATSLIAKEMRGMQVDQLATSLTPEEKIHVNMRRLVEARFAVRDLDDMLVSESEAAARQAAQDAAQAALSATSDQLSQAQIKKALSEAFKNIAAGQKNQVGANAEAVKTALKILESGDNSALTSAQTSLAHAKTINTHANTADTMVGDSNANGDAGSGQGDGAAAAVAPQSSGSGGGAGSGLVPPPGGGGIGTPAFLPGPGAGGIAGGSPNLQ